MPGKHAYTGEFDNNPVPRPERSTADLTARLNHAVVLLDNGDISGATSVINGIIEDAEQSDMSWLSPADDRYGRDDGEAGSYSGFSNSDESWKGYAQR
jgi:hypothetical protein